MKIRKQSIFRNNLRKGGGREGRKIMNMEGTNRKTNRSDRYTDLQTGISRIIHSSLHALKEKKGVKITNSCVAVNK